MAKDESAAGGRRPWSRFLQRCGRPGGTRRLNSGAPDRVNMEIILNSFQGRRDLSANRGLVACPWLFSAVPPGPVVL